MKFFSTLLSSLALAVVPPVVLATRVSYDTGYDSSTRSLSTVSCSDGTYGMLTKGYTTFGSLPTYPYIGGASAIAGWNSPNCGTCWKITYQNTSITMLAIDYTLDGFNLSQFAMNNLTNNNAQQLGAVQATTVQVAASACGL